VIPWLPRDPIFPDPETALRDPNGLLAAGGDLSAERLLAAYRRGIFPWYSAGDPILWWSPDPRMVLPPADLKISRSLARTLRNADYAVRFDSAFAEVMRQCADTPRHGQPGTWISAEMQTAYQRLHELGHAHSVETWVDDTLVGGLYGVTLGAAFFGESMFSCRANASKIALAHLCRHLSQQSFGIIDCQMETPHLTSLGARTMPRREFIATLKQLVVQDAPRGKWQQDAALNMFRVDHA
jgi:leucyl/phenylalanyl-tRNA---protein transferase